jgi:hypothetical protein
MAGGDDALFGDALGCEERLPAAFVPGASPGAGAAHGAAMLLRALAVMEEGGEPEREDGDARTAELARVEAKLDLVLALLGAVAAARAPDLPEVALRWSRVGARLRLAEAPALPHGVLRVHLDPRLPQPLELQVRVVGTEPTGAGVLAWLRFEALDPGLEAALERHVFRRHRRAVAESRRQAKA